MKSKHPKFKGKNITQKDHEKCVKRLGNLYSRFVVPILLDTDLYDRGRFHRSWDAPCLYIFRSKELYNTEMRGIIFHIQNTKKEDGIEIVFRELDGLDPLPANDWKILRPERWQPNKKEWRAFRVESDLDVQEGKRLIGLTTKIYDIIFD